MATRAAWLTFWIFGAAFLLKTSLAEGKTLDFDLRQGAADFAEIIPWLGAVFAGVYVALYTRFASQWNYLAALYNQIVEAQLAMPSDNPDDRQNALAAWKAGFIEDAEELHLATKSVFLVAVLHWGQDEEVAAQYAKNTVGGGARLEVLLIRLGAIWDKAHRERSLSAQLQLAALRSLPTLATDHERGIT